MAICELFFFVVRWIMDYGLKKIKFIITLKKSFVVNEYGR